jgi:uncharacterized protein
LDVFYGRRPGKKSETCYFFFDEIQNVQHWERFIRRLLDTESVSVFVTGSSAKLLSVELATGLRGRSLDREVFPFSFREYLRARNISLEEAHPGHQTRLEWVRLSAEYCRQGGFPELLPLASSQRHEVAQSYVDAVVLRDVVERHGISNTEALRFLLYHLLQQPATKVSIHKLYLDFKSRGLRVAKDDLYAFTQHLCDAYLLFQVPLWTRSEKKRQVNPKKMYFIDNGILDAYSTSFTPDYGTFLENLVFISLRRQGLDPGYYITKRGFEVDFVYSSGSTTVLIQVAWSLENEETRLRERRPLIEAAKDFPQTRKMIITLDEESEEDEWGILILPLWKFLLSPAEKVSEE